MSSGSGQVVAYLQRQLSQNPVHQSPEIIALRAKAFRLKRSTATPTATDSSSAEQRSQLRDQLEAIRSQCFTAPVDQLQQQLAGLSLSAYPDLEALAKRLQVIVHCRTKLPQLTTDRRFNGDFFACLKKVLTQPARDVAVLREQVLNSFQKGRLRRRGQAMIRLLKEQVPELYALEADWLESLLQVRSHFTSFTLSTSGENSGNTAIGAGLVIVLVTGLILFLAVPRSERDRSPPARYPANAAPVTPPEYPKTYPPDSFVERFEPDGDRVRTRQAERRRQIEESRREAERRSKEFQREAERTFEEFRRRHANLDDAFSDLPDNFPQPRFAPMPGEPGESRDPENPFDVPPISPAP